VNHPHTGKRERQNRNVIFLAELLCGFGNLRGIARRGEELGNAREPEEVAGGIPIRRPARRHNQMPPVPGKAGVAGMALSFPWAANLDGLPATVIERGRGPRRIVAGAKLPGAVERQGWRSRDPS
jgi:hypothetical protein